MSMKPFDGDFDALTGAIFASWFSLDPKGPAAYALGFAETTDRPWSLFTAARARPAQRPTSEPLWIRKLRPPAALPKRTAQRGV
jgi:hypothetical protein